jgi:hypothetical protein
MLRHHHITEDIEFLAITRPCQRIFKQIPRSRILKIRQPVETTERDKMNIPALLSPFQPLNHPGILQLT